MAAIRLIEKMATEFGASLDFTDLLHAKNFEAVAVAVEMRAASHLPSPDVVHNDPADLQAPFPLTEVQRAYWLGRTHLFELGGVAAHGYVEIDGDGLDHDRLESALSRTIQRHPMLRATIGSDGLQRIACSVPKYQIARIDLTDCTDGERTARLAATRGAMAQQVLPADRWPLFDIRHSRLPNDRSRLHISFDVLVLDLASLEHWISEWALFYEKPNTQLEPLTVHFGDYVRTLAALRQGEAGQKALAYWEQRLETLPPCPELPLACDPSTVGTPRFRRLDAELPADVWQSLRNQAAAMGLTPSMVLLTAYAEILGQWSRNQHFTLNLTVFNRLPLGPGFDAMLGDFTSLILLETDLRELAGFADRARRLQSQLWKDLDHRLVSGVDVVARLAGRQRTPGRALMPVVFTSGLGIDSLYDAFERFGGITHSVTQTPQTWLDHQALERNGGLLLIWDSVETLFPDGVLDTMFAAYVGLVRALADGAARWDRPVKAFLPGEQLAARATVNATGADIAPGLLYAPFVATARLQPEAPAVIAPDLVLDYRTLERASARLARRIEASGARRNQLVAICLPRGWRQVLAAVAVVRAGAAYLPLDPALPAARLHAMLSQGGASLVLTETHPCTAWPDGTRTLVVDTDLLAEEADETGPLPDAAGPEDLAYVIFTSGSTGTPKGVMVEHRAALNTILDVNKRFGVGPADRGIALSALGFDLSVYDIFGLLGAGAALVVPPPSQSPEPETWRRLIADTGVTVWNTVPALLRIYADHLRDHEALTELTRLRLVMTSGDWLPVSLAETIAALPGERRFVSLGGATEAAIWSIAQPIEQVDTDWTSVPYGKPLANQRLHILDRHFRSCPDWVPGDIYIAGLGLARGYWGDREQTQRSFVLHPDTGERLYRTGDVGRYGPDGTIHFLGRSDDQVKVNGLRVELGEIESVLGRKTSVRQAAAVVVRSADFGDRLVAFAVPAGTAIDAEALRADLRRELPASLVPVAIYAIDAIPLTHNAKVDRNALTDEVMRRTQQNAEIFRAPADMIEARIADIWCELLAITGCGVDRNFFEAGGTSLLATRLAQRLGEAFHLSVPVVALFEHPTIAAQAVHIRHQVNADRREAPQAAQASLRGEERRRLLLAAMQAPTDRIPS